MISRAVAVLLSAALIAVGAGLALIGLSLPDGGTEVVSRGLPVNPGATDPRDFSSHNSPTLARSPVRPSSLVLVSRMCFSWLAVGRRRRTARSRPRPRGAY